MFSRRVPLLSRHAAAPGARDFALLYGLDAAVRGLLISVMPLEIYRTWRESAAASSNIYLTVGIVSLFCGLSVPWATRLIPRRWMYTLGCLCYLAGAIFGLAGGGVSMAISLGFNSVATVTLFVCLNAYVLDYIARNELVEIESLKVFFSAVPWVVGPMTGVWLLNWWRPAPFLVAGLAALVLLAIFWMLRLGNGKAIARARGPTVNPLSYLARFAVQPRLIAGWLFAVIRSSGWWVYVVYLPIFCVEAGLGDRLAATALSASNLGMFLAPLVRRMVKRFRVRRVLQTAFGLAGVLYVAGAAASGAPWAAVVLFWMASYGLAALDASAGLPFLMAVRPSERVEMAAVYSSFRDVSSIFSPGVAALVLLVAPVSGIFAAMGGCLLGGAALAGTLHPRLGHERPESPDKA